MRRFLNTTAIRALAIVPGDPRLLYAITDRGAARGDDGGLTRVPPDRSAGRPTRLDTNLPATGACRGPSAPQYDPSQGWQQSSEGLPVFLEEVRDW
jgi:hypothetical protein